MNKESKWWLIAIFALVFFVKVLISYFIPSISAFSDEYFYLKMARSFFFDHSISIHNISVMMYPPLYSMLLSITYFFNDMQVVYFLMKVINALISTSIIFPFFLLAKEFVGDKKALLLAFLIAVLPSNFSFTNYILAENLFYPLVLWCFYFMYKAFTTYRKIFFYLTGIFMGLSFMTKFNGLFLFAVPLFYLIFNFKNYTKLRKGIFFEIYGGAIFVSMFWFIRNKIVFGRFFNDKVMADVTSYAVRGNYFLELINWCILYFDYLILASGIIFGVVMIISFVKWSDKPKEKTFYLLALLFIIFTILMAANHATGLQVYKTPISFFSDRPLGRYIDVILPLVFLIGFMNFDRVYSKINKYTIIISLLLLLGGQLAITPLLPVNNLSLTHIGIYKQIIEFITLHKANLDFIFSWQTFIIMSLSLFYIGFLAIFIKRLGIKKIVYSFIVFFLLLNIANYGILYYNVNTNWYKTNTMQMGLYLNKIDNDPNKLVIIDSRDCGGKIFKNGAGLCEDATTVQHLSSVTGTFINKNIMIANPLIVAYRPDYIITKHKMDLGLFSNLKLIKVIGDVRLYKDD